MIITNESLPTKLIPFVITTNRLYGGMAGTTDAPLSLGAGTPAIGELSVNTTELSGLKLDAADEVYFLLDVHELWNFDLSKDLWGKVTVESGKAGVTTAMQFRLDLKGVSTAQAVSDAKSSPDASILFPTNNTTAPGVPTDTLMQAFNAPGVFGTTTVVNGENVFTVTDRYIQGAFTCVAKGDAAADDIRLLSIVLFGTAKFLNDNQVKSTT